MAASVASDPIRTSLEDNVSIEVSWTTSDVVGTLTLEGSVSGSVWTTLDTSPESMTVTSSDDNGLFDITQIGFPYLRLKFTRVSGSSGTLNAYVSAKQV